MKMTVSVLGLGLAIGMAMAQDPPAPPPANQNAAPPAAKMPAPAGNAPTEMKTSTYKGTLVDQACVGNAWVTTAEPNTANRTTGECKVSPESKQFGMRLEDGRTLRFDIVGSERARQELKTNKRWSKDLGAGKPIRTTVAGAIKGDKMIVSSIH